MARGPAGLIVSGAVYAVGFVWATVLALIAVGGAVTVAIVLAVLGGFVLAWVREHV